jgi:hypothetical protein
MSFCTAILDFSKVRTGVIRVTDKRASREAIFPVMLTQIFRWLPFTGSIS